jgi:hypothetical protein
MTMTTERQPDGYPDDALKDIAYAHAAHCPHKLAGTVVASRSLTHLVVTCVVCDLLKTLTVNLDVMTLATSNGVCANHAGCVQWLRDCLAVDVDDVDWVEDYSANWRLGESNAGTTLTQHCAPAAEQRAVIARGEYEPTDGDRCDALTE